MRRREKRKKEGQNACRNVDGVDRDLSDVAIERFVSTPPNSAAQVASWSPSSFIASSLKSPPQKPPKGSQAPRGFSSPMLLVHCSRNPAARAAVLRVAEPDATLLRNHLGVSFVDVYL